MARRPTPVIDAGVQIIKARRPILGRFIEALRRAPGALFAKGGDMVLPPEPDPVTGEMQRPVTVSVPHGILRDPTVITVLVMVLYWLARLFGWELPIGQDEAINLAQQAVDQLVTLGGLVTGFITRIKSKNITRG